MLDVGETLIDETRVWSTWADILGVPRLTFMAAFGMVLDRGQDFRAVFDVFGASDWRRLNGEVEARYGGFQEQDLYPDALPAVDALHALGYRVGIIANQPSSRSAELRALGFAPDAMAMSDDWGVRKPEPAFFVRALEAMDGPDPADVACVGDRVDNDILPAAAMGMRPVWLRRGPFGVIIRSAPPEAVLVVDSLAELVERIDGCWAAAPVAPTNAGRRPPAVPS
jgi:HAD superfamily hydrolase (TIGR01549 family)